MLINLPVNECDQMTGQFECETFGYPRWNREVKLYHAVDYYTFSKSDNKVDSKCKYA